MVVTQQKRALGIFESAENAEAALQQIKSSGFPMNQVSIIGKGIQKTEDESSDINVSDRIGDTKVDTADNVVSNTASFSAAGFALLGLSSLALPGLGVVLAAGSLAAALAATAASTGVATVASGNLVNGLVDLGIPEEQARVYIDQLMRDKYLVMVEGSEDEIQQAEAIFRDHNIAGWAVYQAQKR